MSRPDTEFPSFMVTGLSACHGAPGVPGTLLPQGRRFNRPPRFRPTGIEGRHPCLTLSRALPPGLSCLAGELEYYEYIDSEGNQAIRTDKRSHRDNERHRVGNYFCTGEHSKSSLIRHAHYSQYEKWLPGSDMARPEVTPEGCEFYGTESREWIPSHDPVRLWGAFMIRWPKTSYKGEA